MSSIVKTETRLHSLDMVRACALLLGIVLHATMSFLPGFREVGWPINDVSSSLTLGVLFYSIHMFRMTLFFTLAGFFARLIHERYGTRAFMRNRLTRVGLPLVVFWPLVLPLTIAPLAWAVAQTGQLSPPTLPAPTPQRGLPWGHLWFLYLLIVLYAMALTLRALAAKSGHYGNLRETCRRLFAHALRRYYIVALLAVPTALVLSLTQWWVPWLGIPTPDRGFIPNAPTLLAFGTAFGFGWLLHEQRDLLRYVKDRCLPILAMAIALTAGTLAIVGVKPDFAPHDVLAVPRAVFSLAYLAGAWCWTFAIIGVGLRFFASDTPVLRYLADASYWMYLVHIPIVWGLQAWMMRWPLHWSIKFPFIVVLATAVLLLSYHFCVRFTWVGAWLNGDRRTRRPIEAVVVGD
jgi:glucan biosynthesis protein C